MEKYFKPTSDAACIGECDVVRCVCFLLEATFYLEVEMKKKQKPSLPH